MRAVLCRVICIKYHDCKSDTHALRYEYKANICFGILKNGK